MRSHQSDSLKRKIIASCGGNAERIATILTAFKAVELDGGTGNTIGDLEILCMEYLASAPGSTVSKAARALRAAEANA